MEMTDQEQILAVLEARSFHYIMQRLGLKESKPVPWREVFTVDRAAVESWLAANEQQVEDYGKNYCLSLDPSAGGWTMRYYDFDPKFGPSEWNQQYPTLGEARQAMLDYMLKHQRDRLAYSFDERPGTRKEKWWKLW